MTMPSPHHEGNLEQARKQAKDLLKNLKAGDAAAIKRFSTLHPHFEQGQMGLADAQLIIAREYGFASWPKMKMAFETSRTLRDEIERLLQQLRADGQAHFIPLLTEEAVKKAIVTGIASYRSLHATTGGTHRYFEEKMVPLFMAIVEKSVWPAFAEFTTAYTMQDNEGVVHDGIMVLLKVRTPAQMGCNGFELSILDVWYGAWPNM